MRQSETEIKLVGLIRNALVLENSVLLTRQTALLGVLPELDSLSLVALITAIEAGFSITIEDDEVSAEMFATVGSLADFVLSKTAAGEDSGCSRSS